MYKSFLENIGSWVLDSGINILFAYTIYSIFGTFQRLVKDILLLLLIFYQTNIYKTICLRKPLSLPAITVERYVVLDAVAFYSYQLDIIALHK